MKLLKDAQADKIEWDEFSRRYRKELFEGGSIDTRNRTIKNHGQKFTLRLLQKLGKGGHSHLHVPLRRRSAALTAFPATGRPVHPPYKGERRLDVFTLKW